MAKLAYRPRIPLFGASAISAKVPVTFVAGASQTVVRTGSFNELSVSFTISAVASPGDAAQILMGGIIDAVAAASLGAGARVAVGSTNGRLIPLAASGGPASANLVAVRYTVGIALENAADAGSFKCLVDPGQVV